MNVLATVLLLALGQSSDSWPAFRGPAGNAIAVGQKDLPTEIGPDQYVLWKTPLPSGHSSPIVYGDRIFLTAVEKKKLYTIALDRVSGKELWRKEAPVNSLEKIHSIGSYAQATCATDGFHVVSHFGSSGLFCYDFQGKQLWHLPLTSQKTEFGAAASPLVVDGKVILTQDFDADSNLSAFDVKTGKLLWKADRAEFATGYACPIIWPVDGKKQIVQMGTLRAIGYDLETGKEIWTVRGMARVCNMTPTISPDNHLILAGWGAGADPGDKMLPPPFEEFVAEHDANKDGVIQEKEMPKGPFRERYPHFDRNRDEKIDKAEWDTMRKIFAAANNRMVAIRPGGKGDITKTHVVWEQKKQLPFIPSPLVYQGSIFLIKNGGLLSSIDPKTGESVKYERIPNAGNYYASPVGGDGKVFLVNQAGELTVVSAEANWQVLHSVNFGEDVYATPAIIDGKIYFRTAGHLYCFGRK